MITEPVQKVGQIVSYFFRIGGPLWNYRLIISVYDGLVLLVLVWYGAVVFWIYFNRILVYSRLLRLRLLSPAKDHG